MTQHITNDFHDWSESSKLLYGLSDQFIVQHTFGEQTIRLHKDVVEPLAGLLKSLQQVGFKAQVLSHWRSFDYQLKIWLKKWTGESVLLDRNAEPMDHQSLSVEEKLNALFYWSALPGLSRHHWGTDFDLFLAAPIEHQYDVQLIPQEFQPGGVCAELDQWFTEHLADFGFYRPYDKDRGGVSPEPWHISYKPIAEKLQQKIAATEVAAVIMGSEIPEKRKILSLLDDYIRQYVHNVAE